MKFISTTISSFIPRPREFFFFLKFPFFYSIFLGLSCLFFSFIYLFRITLFSSATLNWLDLLILFFLITFIFELHHQSVLIKNSFFLFFKKNLLSFFLLFAFILSFIPGYLITLDSENFTDGLGIFKSFLILPILFSIAFSFLISQNFLKFRFLIWNLFLMSCFFGFWGYLALIKGKTTFDGRLELIFNSPNYLASILAIGIISGFYLIFKKNNHFSDFKLFFILIGVFFAGFSLFHTYSLGSFLSILSIVFLSFFIKKYPFLKIFYFLIIVLFSFSLVLFFPYFYKEKSLPTSLDSRLAIYSVSKKIITENWFFGIGIANFQRTYLENQLFFSPYPQWAVPHAHNHLIHFWATGGIFTLILFLILIFLSIKQKSFSYEKLFLEISLFYFLTHNTIDFTFWKNDLSLVFFMLITLNLTWRHSLNN